MGVDTGFANIGVTFARIDGPTPSDLTILTIQRFGTEKSAKKKNIRSVDDNFARARLIASTLRKLVALYKPSLMTFESMTHGGPGQASVMAKMGMCYGLLAGLVEALDLPCVQMTPQEIKKAVCGKKDASKEEIQNALDILFNDTPKKTLDAQKVAQGMREHPYDSLASIVAAWDDEVMRLLRAGV